MATTIGKLNFLVSADASGVRTGLNAGLSELQSFGSAAAGVAASVAAIGIGAAAGVLSLVSHFASVGDQLGEMSARTGVAASTLAEFGAIASQVGGSLEAVEVSVKKMQKTLGGAFQGEKGPSEAIANLGLSITELAGMNPEQQFETIAAAIGEIQNPTQRAAAAMEIFGKSGTTLLPMLANLKALREEARAEGIIPSEKAIADAGRIADAFDKLKLKVSAMWFEMGAALAPAVEPGIDALFDGIDKVQNLIAENSEEISAWAAAIGEAVATSIRSVFELITWFENLQTGTVETTVKILAMVGAFGAAILIVPKVIAAGKAIVAVLRSIAIGQSIAQALSGPSGWATLAIGLAAAAGAGLTVNAMFDGVGAEAEKATKKVSETRKAIADVFSGAEISDGGEGVKESLKILGAEAKEVKKHFEEMRRAIEGRRGVFAGGANRFSASGFETIARAGQEGLIQRELQKSREAELQALRRIENAVRDVKAATEKSDDTPITVVENRI